MTVFYRYGNYTVKDDIMLEKKIMKISLKNLFLEKFKYIQGINFVVNFALYSCAKFQTKKLKNA